MVNLATVDCLLQSSVSNAQILIVGSCPNDLSPIVNANLPLSLNETHLTGEACGKIQHTFPIDISHIRAVKSPEPVIKYLVSFDTSKNHTEPS